MFGSLPVGEALDEALDVPRSGRLEAIVVRLGGGRHESALVGRLSAAAGLAGDRWIEKERRRATTQVSLMDARVIRMLLAQRSADAPPGALELPGNNLVVDLRTSAAVMPPGTRIRIGAALIETNDEEHLGCKKFEARFGTAALAWVNHEPYYDLHLRGLYASVIEDGDIAVGDTAAIVAKNGG